MKRALSISVIVCYLSALGWGVVSHTLQVGNLSHPGMYYVVWDMFCGWSGYENRHHLIAEGVSGAHYQLNPAPWGEFQPYGPAHRPDYDNFGVHSITIAKYVLNNTEHEPISRIYLVEENWSKRYNRPEYIWNLEFEEPLQARSYFHTRCIYDSAGRLLERNNAWTGAMYDRELSRNSRLVKLRQQSRPYLAMPLQTPQLLNTTALSVQPLQPNNRTIQQTSFLAPAEPVESDSP